MHKELLAVALPLLSMLAPCQVTPAVPTQVTSESGPGEQSKMNAGCDAADPIAQQFGNSALGRKMRAGIANFRKMLKDEKVWNTHNAPGGPQGEQAATSSESRTGTEAKSGSGVGVGGENVYMGPDLFLPATPDPLVGQKCMHEGLRCKQEITIHNTQADPPPPAALTQAEKCKTALDEIALAMVDQYYYSEARTQAAAAGKNKEAKDYEMLERAKANHIQALSAWMTAHDCY